MSLDGLRQMGLLRDEREWSAGQQRSRVNIPIMLASAVVGLAGCVAMVFGDGSWLTWVGILAFLAGLFSFIAVNLRAIGGKPQPRDDS